MRLLFIVLVWTINNITFGQTITPLFKCEKQLNNPYGIVCHVDRYDSIYLKQLAELCKELHINYLRSDITWESTHFKNGFYDFSKYDKINNTLAANGITWLPILGHYSTKAAWNDKAQYYDYVNKLAKRYQNIPVWELINELDALRNPDGTKNATEILLSWYESIIPDVHTICSMNNTQLLVTASSNLRSIFFRRSLETSIYEHCDLINLHSYSHPKELEREFAYLSKMLLEHNINKSLWLTECGLNTADINNSNKSFFKKLLPEALKICKIPQEAKVGILRDDKKNYTSFRDSEISLYLDSFVDNIVFINPAELKDLHTADCPVLIASNDESFPFHFIDGLLSYLKRGGTIVLPSGAPFYYNRHIELDRTDSISPVNNLCYSAFHISALFPWSERAKILNAPKFPTNPAKPSIDIEYNDWIFNKGSQAIYMSGDNLKGNDRLIPLMMAGDDKYKGCVAGVYKLDSDLKGNIIFQTRGGIDYISGGTEREQARRLPILFLTAFAYGVEKVFWYNLRSLERDKYNPEDNYGLLHSDLTPKEAFFAYKTLTRLCPSESIRPLMENTNGAVVCSWTTPDGKHVYCLWSLKNNNKASFTTAGKFEIVNILGESQLVDTKKTFSLKLTSTPVYLLCRKQLKIQIQ